MANVLTVIFTGVIALATVVYVVFTIGLWRATKQSANAAKAAADAARATADAATKSAEIDAALHRPHLGVPVLIRHNDYNATAWAVRWEVRNYGMLPASDVNIRVEFRRNGHEHGNPVVRGPCEVFPQSSIQGFVADLPVDAETHSNLYKGNWSLHAQVTVSYSASSGRSYRHTAMFVYDRKEQNFRPERSGTEEARGVDSPGDSPGSRRPSPA